MTDPRRSAPAALRNRGPILEVLRRALPAEGLVLEIASGTGEHVVFFAEALDGLRWQPTDLDPENLDSIRAWVRETGVRSVAEPLALDVTRRPWPVEAADAIVCINMVHISPWAATVGLMEGAGALLAPGAPLVLYGPYRRGGRHTAPSNEAFDESLRARDPSWGVRDLEAMAQEAEGRGLALEEVAEMPANNLSLVFRRV
ncbi:DUF938 domain-containing protein [Indioceanicola profundi]|uniref:DUF938 domain-containing protein n=1 Tax=Indioceanicola profundi TaxID=2220096 RepID=UPI000E6AC68F|nr:DUF938 domain-containing protein [Indioceanicola profundi]